MSIRRVITVVGASAGIGAGFARCFSDEAKKRNEIWALILVARRQNELNQLADDIRNEFCIPLVIVCDVTKRNQVENVLGQTIERFGFVSCWINNVGLGVSRSVLNLTDDDVDTMISVNLKTALYGMQTVVPQFRRQGFGHLINISSLLARIPYVTFRSMYSASKAALNSLTTALRLELQATSGCEKIFITTVIPGLVKTNFVSNAIGDPTPKTFADYKIPYTGPIPKTVQTVEDVSLCVLKVMDSENPPREIFTNPEHEIFAKQFANDVETFELSLKPPEHY